MEPSQRGDLVRVAGGGPAVDGIVFGTPSGSKVVVAVLDPTRGPVFRTVSPSALSERSEEGPDDRALRLLMRRTPPPTQAAVRGAGRSGQGRDGYTRSATHRSTGR
ncbi:MAG: hypothetical protein ACJ780_25925 [Solirubrobacteraceae bacterium]